MSLEIERHTISSFPLVCQHHGTYLQFFRFHTCYQNENKNPFRIHFNQVQSVCESREIKELIQILIFLSHIF